MSSNVQPEIHMPEKQTHPAPRDNAPVLNPDKPTIDRTALSEGQIAAILAKSSRQENESHVNFARRWLNSAFGFMWDFQIIDKEYSRDGDVERPMWSALVTGRLILNHSTGQTLIVRDRMGYASRCDFAAGAINDAADDALVECLLSLGVDI